MCALAEGVWPVWGPAGPPRAGAGPASMPYRSASEADMPDGDAAVAAGLLDSLVSRGCGEWLTAEQAADPTECALVAPVWIVTHSKRTVPPGAASASDRTVNIPALAAAAAQASRAEAEAYLAAAAGATPDSSDGRSRLSKAWAASMGATTVSKRRLVERFDL